MCLHFLFGCVIGCGERITPIIIDALESPVVIKVEEISYYADEELSIPLERALVGDTVYTKVVFSQVPAEVCVAYRDDLFGEWSLYHIVSNTLLQDGEAKPFRGDPRAFVCKRTLGSPWDAYTEVVIPKSLNRDFSDADILKAYYGDSDELTTNFSGNGGDSAVFIDFIEFDEDVSGHHAYAGAGYALVYGRRLEVDPFRFYVHDQKDQGGASVAHFEADPHDFGGLVLSPFVLNSRYSQLRSVPSPVEGALLTVLSGPRRGEVAVTDAGGRYLFSGVEEDELHLLVEREHFETKEVIVHRSLPTRLSDGTEPMYRNDLQRFNGVVLIGQRWPDEVRFIFEQVEVVPDLLRMEMGDWDGTARGLYHTDGVIICYAAKHDTFGDYLHTLAHEIFHAHQDFVVSSDGTGRTKDWIYTDEGQSFIAAKNKDWEEVGKIEYDFVEHYANSDLENAAHTAAVFFGAGRWELTLSRQKDLKVVAPHRYKWCQEWLKK